MAAVENQYKTLSNLDPTYVPKTHWNMNPLLWNMNPLL